jgi:hypothetical protein
MAERITVERCKKLLEAMGKKGKFKVWTSGPWSDMGGFFYIEVAYGKPRIHYALRGGGESDFSPRLPARQLYEWMHEQGVEGFRTFLKYKRIR